MTFNEARLELDTMLGSEKVASEMEDWHPSLLAEILNAVWLAYNKRSSKPHPDFNEAVLLLNSRNARKNEAQS